MILPHHTFIKSLLKNQKNYSNKLNKTVKKKYQTKNHNKTRKNRKQQLQTSNQQKQTLIIFKKLKKPTSQRLQRYSAATKTKKLKSEKKLFNIGEFRLMKDQPIDLQVDKQQKTKNLNKIKNDLQVERIIVRQQNNYTLLSSDNVHSPLGNVAKMLMKVIMKAKNKTIAKPLVFF